MKQKSTPAIEKANKQDANGAIIQIAIELAKEELTKKLMAYAKKKRLSGYVVGKECGFTRTQWSRVVSGVSINVFTLMKIAAGLKMKFIFDGTGQNGEILSIDVIPSNK